MTESTRQRARDKILGWDALETRLGEARERGRRIVFTNGCFDVLHVGHTRYLEEARALGDLLVVGLNSDSSVRGLKGPRRPIVPEADRAETLAALAAVDYVVLFDELTPEALLRRVRPDIHAKGGDYRAEDLKEAPLVRSLGGEVKVMPLVEGHSTTDIVRTILERYGEP
jgi:D-beta-D-heptose 7-phosphate kinase / D-beta-D-heptose 1-phosphate adenosyltransferase